MEEDNTIQKDDGKINYNILLERRPHFCSEIIQDMDLKHKEKEKEKEKEINMIQIEENGIKEDNFESNLDINEEKKDNKFELIKTIIQNERLNISKMIEDDIDKNGE